MKKLYLRAAAALIAVSFLWIPAVTAYADAIWEPFGDFYMEHYNECRIVAETYLTNGQEGYVTVYEDPASFRVAAIIKNGKSLYVGCSWKDKKGHVWGGVDLWGFEPEEDESLEKDMRSGWVLMNDMAELYHEGDFQREHSSEFEEYGGELDDYKIQNTMYMWTYPGSGSISGEISNYFSEGDVPDYEFLYTDADGYRWTRINYYYGIRNCWICIDEPENKDLTVSYEPGIISQKLYPAKTPGPEAGTHLIHTSKGIMTIAIVSVAAVVVLTAVLIAVIFRKKK